MQEHTFLSYAKSHLVVVGQPKQKLLAILTNIQMHVHVLAQ